MILQRVNWYIQGSVAPTSSEVSEMASPIEVSQTHSDLPDIRYRQTTSVGEISASSIQTVTADQVAAAPPSRHDVDVAATETTNQPLQQQECKDASQLLDTVIRTLFWSNDIRIDPVIIVVVITVLYL